jgi:ankyrin repeat protein
VNAARKCDEFSPLMIACKMGHAGVVHELCARGESLNHIDAFNSHTPLMIAIMGGHLDVFCLLAKRGANVNDSACNGSTPLMIACNYGHWRLPVSFVTKVPM